MTIKEKFIEKMLGFENLIVYGNQSKAVCCYYWNFLDNKKGYVYCPNINFKCRNRNRYRDVSVCRSETCSLFIHNPASVHRLMAKMAKHVMRMEK